MRRNRDAVAKSLFCLGILEGRAFQLFGRISEKIDVPNVKFSLLYIAYDRLKNSVILGELSKNFAMSEVKVKDYGRVLGEVWKIVEDLSMDTLEIGKIAEENLLPLINRLIVVYTLIVVQLKTLRFLSKEISKAYDLDLEVLQGILELVIEDEETDAQVLMTLKDLFTEKPKTSLYGTPTAKYTNPDRWYESVIGPS